MTKKLVVFEFPWIHDDDRSLEQCGVRSVQESFCSPLHSKGKIENEIWYGPLSHRVPRALPIFFRLLLLAIKVSHLFSSFFLTVQLPIIFFLPLQLFFFFFFFQILELNNTIASEMFPLYLGL